jgi:chemotaxis protein methyltransferase CheR
MTGAEFGFLSDLIRAKSGIHLGEMKLDLLEARLGKRLRALGIPKVRDYLRVLREDPGGEELERLVDVVTTNKTDFFREAGHFDHLLERVLPDHLRSARAAAGEPLRVWSAACSSGEEAYSLAMVLQEALGPGGRFKILATDISSRMLRRAMDGAFTAAQLAPVPRRLRDAYFEPCPDADGRVFRAGGALRAAVQFNRFNLADPGQYVFSNPFDAIFCRNVLIYFDRPTQEGVVASLAGQLAPGGVLYTGFSESLIGIRHSLKPAGASVYRARGAWAPAGSGA